METISMVMSDLQLGNKIMKLLLKKIYIKNIKLLHQKWFKMFDIVLLADMIKSLAKIEKYSAERQIKKVQILF